MDYWEGKNQGGYYLCDRCSTTKLSYDEFTNNIRDIYQSEEKMRYCNECRTYISLQKWECSECKSHGTLRSDKILHKTCCGKVVLL